MKTVFGILSGLNWFACVVTLTIFLLFYRRPSKKDSIEESIKEKQSFRGHWIILGSWVLGTVLVSGFEINILWVVVFIVAGAYAATLVNPGTSGTGAK